MTASLFDRARELHELATARARGKHVVLFDRSLSRTALVAVPLDDLDSALCELAALADPAVLDRACEPVDGFFLITLDGAATSIEAIEGGP